jgi:peptidoglycan/xylan/chitin deacetylase (PgdA/CDA1 family)
MSTPILNFTFHGIGEPPAAVSAAERDVWLSEADFTAALGAIRALPEATVSFDDGNASDLEIALPALREHQVSATFFVVGARLGQPGYLGADDLRTLRDAGMAIGLHGMRHQPWRRLPDRELDEEITGARRLLEDELGAPLRAAACPFGSYDRRVLNRLRRSGFQAVFTSDGGRATAGAWLQPRNTLRAGDGASAIDEIVADEGAAVRGKRQIKTLVKRWR